MKMQLLIALLLVNTLASQALDEEKPVASKVKNVTVFINQAQVTNTAQVSLSAGNTLLVFEELSTKLQQQSVQVSAKGNLTIMSVKHRMNYQKSQAKAQKIKQLEENLETLTDQLGKLEIQKKTLKDEEAMILANKELGGQQTGVNSQRLKEVADFYRQRLSEVNLKVFDLEKDIKKLQEKITKVRQQITEENANANKPSSEILVLVKTEAPITASFELNYIVYDAGWVPIYDLRAKDSKSPIQLNYRANVFQNTGIDWENVQIKLSTGNPALGGNKPELNPWYVDVYNPSNNLYRASNMREKKARYESGASQTVMAEELVKEDEFKDSTIADFTQISENTLSTDFEILIPYTIPSDGKAQLVDIQKYDIPTIYAHSTTPKLDKDAFLIAKLVDWEKFNLISGEANVYFEGSFVGQTLLDAQNIKDTLSISLGRDKKIVVERKPIVDFTSKKFLGSNVKEEFAFETQIRNTKKETISITIEEQVPISKNSKIEVELLEATGAKFDQLTGKITWKVNIEPNSVQKFVLRYSIKYPKSIKVYLY